MEPCFPFRALKLELEKGEETPLAAFFKPFSVVIILCHSFLPHLESFLKTFVSVAELPSSASPCLWTVTGQAGWQLEAGNSTQVSHACGKYPSAPALHLLPARVCISRKPKLRVKQRLEPKHSNQLDACGHLTGS